MFNSGDREIGIDINANDAGADGTPHPQYLEGMARAMMEGLRAALSAPRSGPVN